QERKRLVVSSLIPQQVPVQPTEPETQKQGMLRRVLSELRPYMLSILFVFAISLTAIPLALVSPLPIKILVDNVLGTRPLPGYLRIITTNPSLVSAQVLVVIAIVILVVGTVLTNGQQL